MQNETKLRENETIDLDHQNPNDETALLPKYTNSPLDNYEDDDQETQQTRKSISFFKLLFHFATKFDIVLIIFAFIFSILAGLSLPLFNVIFGDTINIFSASNSPNFKEILTVKIILFIIAGAGIFVVSFFCTMLWNYIGNVIVKRLKEKNIEAIFKQEQGFFDSRNSFEFATRLQTQSSIIESGLSEKIGYSVKSFVSFFSAFIVAFFVSWKLSLVISIVLPFMILIGYLIEKIMSEGYFKSFEAYSKAGGHAEESLYNIKTVASFANFDQEIKRFKTFLKESLEYGLSNAKSVGLSFGAMFFIIFCSFALAVWYGSILLARKELNFVTGAPLATGDILACLFCIVFGAMSLGQTIPSIKSVNDACEAATEFFEIMERKPHIDLSLSREKPPKEVFNGKIEFKGVAFSYPTKPDSYILDNMNLVIEPGKHTAIVGESGSGKSTIISLIERLYDVNSGQVKIDSFPVKDLDVEYYRSMIGYVPQEPILFNMSIRDNIVFGREGQVTEDDIIKACQKASCMEFINKFEDGLDTIVGIKGSKLSGGQKQRIAIARAILTRPKILLLDEATSALDNKSEQEVKKALNYVSRGLTTITVAHRLSTILHADRIIVLDKGQIKETGNHNELYRLKGIYTHLIQSQIESMSQEDRDFIEKFNDNSFLTSTDENNTNSDNDQGAPLLEKQLRLKKSNSFKSLNSFEDMKVEETIEVDEQQSDSDFKNAKSKLNKVLLKHKCSVICLGIFAGISGAIWPIYGYLIAYCINVYSIADSKRLQQEGVTLGCAFLGISVISGIVNFLQNYLYMSLGEKITYYYRQQLYKKFLTFHIGYFDKEENSPGALLSRMSADTTKVNSIGLAMIDTVSNISVSVLIGLIIGFTADWKITLICCVLLPFLIFNSIISLMVISKLKQGDVLVDSEAGSLFSECVNNTKTIYAYNVQSTIIDIYSRILGIKQKKALKNSLIYGLLSGIQDFISFLIYAIVFFIGGLLILNGQLTNQNLMIATFPLLFCVFSVGMAQQYVSEFAASKVALVNIYKTLEDKSEINPYDNPATNNKNVVINDNKELMGSIEFRDVHFAYPTRPDSQVLKGVNFRIEPGQSVAFVGLSGSGKSTIVQLIERFYDPVKGMILIDGKNIKDYNLIQLRKKIGLVMQEPVLFKRSIIDNIKYGNNDATLTEVRQAAELARIAKYVDKSDEHKELPVSGGEKQRLAIARVILKNPRILLLDEATSALDKVSEELVQQSLEQVSKGRTSLIIAHRLSTIENCDVIYVMEHGQIVEMGNHKDLLNKRGKYFSLYNAKKE